MKDIRHRLQEAIDVNSGAAHPIYGLNVLLKDSVNMMNILESDLSAALARAEKAETGSYRVDAAIERFLERWDHQTKEKDRHDFIVIDVLEDVVATLRTQRRKIIMDELTEERKGIAEKLRQEYWANLRKYHPEVAQLERDLSDEKQKVANLEEYMLKGVAFRDELQARAEKAEGVICSMKDTLAKVRSKNGTWCGAKQGYFLATPNESEVQPCGKCALCVIDAALSSSAPCPHEICDNCKGGCPDKDHPAVHHLCEECHQESVNAFDRVAEEVKRLREAVEWAIR